MVAAARRTRLVIGWRSFNMAVGLYSSVLSDARRKDARSGARAQPMHVFSGFRAIVNMDVRGTA